MNGCKPKVLHASSGAPSAMTARRAEDLAASRTRSATRAELFALFDHLESELDQSGFLYPPEKRPTMVRAIRNMFHRMGATDQDIRTWRGIVAALAGRPEKVKTLRGHSSAPFLLLR